MTIQNKDWYLKQTLRLSLSGLSQEQIAQQLKVSEGTINAFMQELVAYDDTLMLQHEIAIVSKRSGISIKELASNMTIANAIKQKAVEGNKIEAVFRAINSFCVEDGSHDANAIARLFVEFCDLINKNQISPANLYKKLEAEYDEHNKLVQQIERVKINLSQIQQKLKSELESYNTTTKTLQDFLNLKEDFEGIGLDFDKKEEILNILYNIDHMDKDPKKIADEIKHIRFLKVHEVSLMDECEKIEKILEYYKKEIDKAKERINMYGLAFEVFNNILQKGISPENILKIFDIYSKHPYLSLDEFSSQIDTYGGIQGAINKKFLDYIRINSVTQDLTSYTANTNH